MHVLAARCPRQHQRDVLRKRGAARLLCGLSADVHDCMCGSDSTIQGANSSRGFRGSLDPWDLGLTASLPDHLLNVYRIEYKCILCAFIGS